VWKGSTGLGAAIAQANTLSHTLSHPLEQKIFYDFFNFFDFF
jgi:hypothetical protein